MFYGDVKLWSFYLYLDFKHNQFLYATQSYNSVHFIYVLPS